MATPGNGGPWEWRPDTFLSTYAVDFQSSSFLPDISLMFLDLYLSSSIFLTHSLQCRSQESLMGFGIDITYLVLYSIECYFIFSFKIVKFKSIKDFKLSSEQQPKVQRK